MKHLPIKSTPRTKNNFHEGAQTRMATLGLAVLIAGVMAGGLWLYREGPKAGAEVKSQGGSALSANTKAVLQKLKSPVELRYYSLLDSSSVPASVQDFAGRVDRLLALYQAEANGQIQIARCTNVSDANAKAAVADGLKPFNLEKGDASFLGIAVLCNGRMESLPQLAAEWEVALESDLSRAIARVLESPNVAPVAKTDAAAVESVKRAIPNLDAVPLEQAMQVLRDAALADVAKMAQELDARQKQAQQRLFAAQANQSEAEEQAAMMQLRQIQQEQTEGLKKIAAQSKAQMTALQQLKAKAE